MEFTEGIKNWFFRRGSQVDLDSRVCLLDANGDIIGSNKVMEMLSLPYKSEIGDAFVDLGLPSGRLWSKRNLGALSETDYGWYASWGNVEAHAEGQGYDFSEAVYNASPAASIAANLNLSQDVVHAYLGGAWRMPTSAEFAELFNSTYTTNEWVTNYNNVSGLNGRKVTSKINGNSIFFPAAGRYNGTSLTYRGTLGYYWSASWVSEADARGLGFYAAGVSPQDSGNRRYGFSLRGVM